MIKPYCDDCQRKHELPSTGPQHYGRCSYCNIIRACWGDPAPGFQPAPAPKQRKERP